jgi:thiol:disulfide interchange protein DsbA
MKRRTFSQAAASVALTSALPLHSAQAQMKNPQVGVDYQVLEKPAPLDGPAGKIELVEFFWYGCPHCNAFEPTLAGWIKKLPPYVAFRRSHVTFRDDFVPQQRLFLALDAMKLTDKLHAKVFAAIHQEKLDLSQGNAIVDWVVAQGVDRNKFLENYNSFSVASKGTRARQIERAYGVEGVPAFGIGGRFYTDGAMAHGMDRAVQVVEFLIASIRAGR